MMFSCRSESELRSHHRLFNNNSNSNYFGSDHYEEKVRIRIKSHQIKFFKNPVYLSMNNDHLIFSKLFLNLCRVVCKTKVNNISEEDNEAKEEPAYSDHVIELSENHNPYCGVEVSYDTPQMMSIVDDPESNYNTLREYKVEQADKNLYDCAENVSGIYAKSFQRNPYTTSGLSDNLGSLESCTDT